jgi:hypothetical protein
MMTFVLAAAMFVGALCVAAALDSATTEAPAGARALAARLLATDSTVPVALSRRREPVSSKTGQERAVTVCEANLTTRLPALS